MAITWNVTTELINADTELRKVMATRIKTNELDVTLVLISHSFAVKARMKTKEEKDAVWADIWSQYQAIVDKENAVDLIADAGKIDLEGKEVS